MHKYNTVLMFSCIAYSNGQSQNYKPDWIVVLWFRSWHSLCVYLIIIYNSSNFVSVKKHIQCSDYFGNHRQVYNTTGEPRDLEIVNDVAYYVQYNPGR